MKHISRMILGTAAFAAIVITGSASLAYAQEVETVDPDKESIEIEEVIVTAQRREQRLMDVPASVGVVSGQFLDEMGLSSINDIELWEPTISIQWQEETGASSIFLRGVGTMTFSSASEPSVATIVDGIVSPRGETAFGDVYDIERIEVLRGPQGTLFGKNSSAGSINVITRGPAEEFEGYVSAGTTSDGEVKVKGSISVPFSDKVRARISGFSRTYDGNLTNLYNGEKVNGFDREGVRAKLVADVSERTKLTFTADWWKAADACCSSMRAQSDGGIYDAASGITPNNGSGLYDVDLDLRQINYDQPSRGTTDNLGFSFQADFGLGEGTFTSITAYNDMETTQYRDGDFLPTLQTDPVRPPYVNSQFMVDFGESERTWFSQEFRYASPTDGRLQYQVGALYWGFDNKRRFTRTSGRCNRFVAGTDPNTLPVDSTGFRPCLDSAILPSFAEAYADIIGEFDNYGLYGQLSYELNDLWELTAGLRYTRDEVSFEYERFSTTGGSRGPGVFGASPYWANDTKEDDVSGKIAFSYSPNDSSQSYVSYTRGYKGPAFNVFYNMGNRNPFVAEVRQRPIKPETVDSYEVGYKASMLEGRLSLRMAAYFAEYKNFQANNYVEQEGAITTFFTNAGDVSTRGIEIDFNLRASEKLRFRGGVTYVDAHVDVFFTPETVQNAPRSEPGEKLPFAPDWKGSVQAIYSIGSFSLFDVFLRTSVQYEGERWAGFGESADKYIEPRTLWNASVGLRGKDGRLELNFRAVNLLDEPYYIGVAGGPPLMRVRIPRNADRHFGMEMQYNF